ncbi:hypothetical protein [Pedobacter sp. GR22-6]|uniref:hypothetical protein n=1 Tax=Pedobacter sp. GR22-6 TaxID=3127957 RepID=UPI00307E049F
MKKFTLSLIIFLCLPLYLFFTAFIYVNSLEEDAAYVHKLLNDHYDAEQGGIAVKRYELSINSTGFCRYKRYFTSGKVEYFSFNLQKFKDLDYLGNNRRGLLLLNTKGEDVIVQTYKDRKNGDVDSMSTFLTIPLKEVEPEDLIELMNRLTRMNALLSTQK